jgi:antirestriction protein ArdC
MIEDRQLEFDFQFDYSQQLNLFEDSHRGVVERILTNLQAEPAAWKSPLPPRGSERLCRNWDERIAWLDRFIESTGAIISERQSTRAFYSCDLDYISMPSFDAFGNAHLYYAALLHELVHWSGHSSRLNRDFMRDLLVPFGNRSVALSSSEELVAGFGCAFLCQDFGLYRSFSHSGYIAAWSEDPHRLIFAALQAQAAVNFLHDLALADRPKGGQP